MPSDLPDDDIRVGTPEREQAIALLNESFSAGYLQVDEFEERSSTVYVARTRGELRATLHDLPAYDRLFLTDARPTAPAQFGAKVPPEMKPLKVKADWDTKRRRGSWKVPPQIYATAEMGTVHLDFSQAHFLAGSVEVNIQGSASTVKVWVGADQQVQYYDLSMSGMSRLKDRAGAPVRVGGPLIVLAGHLSAMSVVSIKRR